MSHNYDNWERLVAAVKLRMQYLELALRSDSSSSSDDDMEGQNSEHEHAVVVITDEPTVQRASSESTVCKDSTSTCGFYEANTSSKDAKERLTCMKKLLIAIVLCIVLMNIKIIAAIKTNSLAILTDAAHLLWDVAAFAISLFSLWAAGREATPRQRYGFYRVEVLGALVSIQLVMILAGILVYEAIGRLIHNQGKVQGALMFAVSAFGLLVNITMKILLGHDYSHGHDHSQSHLKPLLNGATGVEVKSNGGYQKKLRSIIGDSIQSISVMIGGALVWYKPEWKIIDLICTLIFSVIVLGITVKMLRKILEVLMESTPKEMDATKLEKAMCEMEEVVAVHDLHIWDITVGKVLLSCCVKVRPLADADVVLDKVIDYIKTGYNISHVTIQIETI